MVINISAKQKSDIGTVFKEYLRGRYSGGLKIKRIQGKKARDDAFLAAYKRFSGCKAEAYKVATIYGIKVCPYCNINYTYVVKRGKKCVCRPDFDHFVAKTDCPKKALDIMNLIPCCQQCNSRVKHKKHFSRRSHIHPYYDDFDSCYRFDYRLRKKGLLSESNLEILLNVLDSSGRTGKFIADMELWPRYQNHKDFVYKVGDFTDGKIYPRLIRTYVGDIMTLNTFEANTSNTAETTGVALEAGNYLQVGSTGFLEVAKSSGTPVSTMSGLTGMVWKVIKIYTMPDSQQGVKIQRVQ